MSAGRPTTYTVEIAEAICVQLSAGKTLRRVCKSPKMPHEATVRTWVRDDREGFKAMYSAAREIGYHMMADELLEIVDSKKSEAADKRVRFDARRWLLSKALPKIYGEKLDLNATHEVGNSVAELMRQIDGRTRGLPKDRA
jgi:hypothetical protein